jgi:hypothetical protein
LTAKISGSQFYQTTIFYTLVIVTVMTVLFQHYKENATDSFSSIIAFLHCSAIKQINQHGQSFKPLPQLDLSIEEG